jgi:CheY-like chemotaxis protein
VQHVAGYLGPRKRVLVVDDAAVDRQLLQDLLGPLGFSVTPAASGIDALSIASQVNPDLVLMDIDMPGMDGWETARLLRGNHISEAPILIVSANAFAMEPHDEIGVGREDFLVKPIKVDDLLVRIRNKLDLDWIARAEPQPATPVVEPSGLASDSLEALRELGELGYVRGILEKLDELDRLDPACIVLTRDLRDCVQRFDLPGYAHALNILKERAHAG